MGAAGVAELQYPTAGGDVFEARFEHARVRWAIVWSQTQNKVAGLAFKTLAPRES